MTSFTNRTCDNDGCSISLCQLRPKEGLSLPGGSFLHPQSVLREHGVELILSWNFESDEGGIPAPAMRPIAEALLRLGAVTFPFLGYWTQTFEPDRGTRAWLVKTPWGHRLRAWLLQDRAPLDRKIRIISTIDVNVLCDEQLGWSERFLGFVVISRELASEETWTWDEVQQFSAGIVDDRSGTLWKRQPIAIVVPGTDAEYLWIWCATDSLGALRQSLAITCGDAGIGFHQGEAGSP